MAERRSNSWFLQSSHGFHDEATRAGRTVTSEILRREVEELPQWAGHALDLPPGSMGVTLERVRYVDGVLVMYVVSHLLEDLADLIMAIDLEHGSLYRALQEGRVKALRRMKQPMTLVLEASSGARDAVARRALASGLRGAGQHIQSRGAQRRADRVALQALVRQEDWNA